MSWQLFDYDEGSLLSLINEATGPVEKLKALRVLLGDAALPQYLLDFIQGFLPNGNRSIAIHHPYSIENYSAGPEMNKELIIRRRGFMGHRELNAINFPEAVHHIRVFHNGQGRARVFYRVRWERHVHEAELNYSFCANQGL